MPGAHPRSIAGWRGFVIPGRGRQDRRARYKDAIGAPEHFGHGRFPRTRRILTATPRCDAAITPRFG